MDEATSAKIRKDNEPIKAEREKMVDEICLRFSQFKRDFIGAPIRRALIGLKSGNVPANYSC